MKMFLQRALPVSSDWELRRFHPRDRIRQLLTDKRPDEDFSEGRDLLIFDTMRQHTWLIPSDKKLYCVIDNRREDAPKISWSFDLDRLRRDKSLSEVEIEDFDEDYGIFKIGDKKVRKFSRNLFSASELKQKLRDLIG